MDSFCSICKTTFSSYGNLNKHIKNVHKTFNNNLRKIPEKPEGNYICKCLSGCKVSFKNTALLIEHIKVKHEVVIPPSQYLQFATYEDFNQWLQWEQRESKVNYFKSCMKKKGNKDVVYFKCNRTSRLDSLNKKLVVRKRRLKSQGYSKICGSCTSHIILTIDKNTKGCCATYCDYHYGHEKDIQHLRIGKKERENIAFKLTQGVPVSRIIDGVRNDITEEKLSRIDIITRKDVQNIKSSFNTKCKVTDRPTEVKGVQKAILDEISSIALSVKQIDNVDNLNIALKFLKSASAVLDLNTNPYINKEPANKKIPKLSFFSTQ